MRRSPTLEVDVNANDSHDDLYYNLDLSPRTSIDSTDCKSVQHLPPPTAKPTPPAQAAPKPSIRLLFSLLSRRHAFCLLLPAVCASVIAGGVAPFMTYVVGQAFDAFSRFPLSANPPQEAKDELMRSIGITAIELVGLGIGALALGSITSTLWIWTGERNTMALRRAVYRSVISKEMVWFDTNLGEQEAGGLMAKFTRETDDVRMATSLASGYLVQYLTTTITCLVLAFVRSWALTLVILSAVPILTLIQSLSQSITSPLLFRERSLTASTATLVDRALCAIPTVKAFNAQFFEADRAKKAFTDLKYAARSLNKVWGMTSAAAQFVMMGMFVQGFWFGSKLVRDGKVSAGDVMATFWACLIATSNLQMCIPQLIALAKGKFAMVALVEMMGDSPTSGSSSSPPTTPLPPSVPIRSSAYSTPFHKARRSQTLKKITPQRCYGEFALHDVSFSYPAKPTIQVLSNVSLFLPANETTFIVGASGSGKSTIAGLLMRMYEPTSGCIMLDDQDVRFLDDSWVRGHIAGVSQGLGGVVVVDGKTLYENVALGVFGRIDGKWDVTQAEVEEACRMAMVHEFVKELPEGYSTVLGSSASQGVALSGGQRQRLALARARVRDPTVLILDEATSALDVTSRILVFEAIKRWRKNKTTIVITHDLSQIQSNDFVYVLKNGRVAEQGYRADLEIVPEPSSESNNDDNEGRGEFRKMMNSQHEMGGYLPEKDLEDAPCLEDLDLDGVAEEEDEKEEEVRVMKERLSLSTIRPLTFGNWMFDVVADLTSQKGSTTREPQAAVVAARANRPLSRFVPVLQASEEEDEEMGEIQYARRLRRPSSVLISPTTPTPAARILSPRMSLQFTPTSPTSTVFSQSWTIVKSKELDDEAEKEAEDEEEKQFGEQKEAVKGAGVAAAAVREKRRAVARPALTVHIPSPDQPLKDDVQEDDECPPPFWSLMRKVWPSIPQKPLLFFGLAVCLASGSITPIFSFLLSRLLFEISSGAQNVKVINMFGGIVLSVAALDGILLGAKYYILESVGMRWATKLRNEAYAKVLKQDKTWFDSAKHAPSRLIQVIVKDGDDSRTLISVVIGQCLVVVAMLSVGLLWAMIRGWELTLVGLGIAPVFAGIMAVQTKLVGKCEVRNKRAREDVARGWYDALCNIKGIRAMGIDKPFLDAFDLAVDKALETGVRGAWVEGGTLGVASGLIYGAEAVLFYVGAVLIARGRYSYLQMVEVLNLVVFSVTIGSQLMAFTEKIAKSVQATHDLSALTDLPTTTSESKGLLKPTNDLLASGPISFENISFAYPSRPNALVLRNFNLQIHQGECIALVGASGSGKSTIAGLMQRLYEPHEGSIRFGEVDISEMDVQWLRARMGVVSQSAQLFEDVTVEENILYATPKSEFASEEEREEVVKRAAVLANVHEFVESLPEGYKSALGEVSGGQGQRIQIARALARRDAELLVLDECTSALDPENQQKVMQAIANVKEDGGEERRKRMMVITHKVEVMRMCDRVVVVKDGEVVEEGPYEELVERKGGVFRELARGGEWESE